MNKVRGFPTGEYATLLHAIADLHDHPVDAYGYARSAVEIVAEVDWHIMSVEELRAILDRIAACARRHVEALNLDPDIRAEVRLGGEGTITGIDGTVLIRVRVAGHPVAMA